VTLGEKSIHIALHLDTQADVTVIMDENFESLKSTRTPQPINDTGKCILSATDVDFFGNSTSVVVVDPLQSNVKAILDFPEPKNMKELASFLGTTNFYLNFIPNYTQLAYPLHQKIASPPILVHSTQMHTLLSQQMLWVLLLVPFFHG